MSSKATGTKYGLLAFQQPNIEFRIPSFVRAAETIVALPKGKGAKEFSARVLRVAPHLASHWWAGRRDLGEKLERLGVPLTQQVGLYDARVPIDVFGVRRAPLVVVERAARGRCSAALPSRSARR